MSLCAEPAQMPGNRHFPKTNSGGIWWTAPMEDSLRQQDATGLSCTKIASAISAEFGIVPPLSRNSVIGKRHRLGLGARRVIGVRRPRPEKKPPAFRPRLPREPKAEKYVGPIRFEVPLEQRRTFMQLEPHQCRWPSEHDDVTHPGFYFCGAPLSPNHGGQPYCAGHAALGTYVRAR